MIRNRFLFALAAVLVAAPAIAGNTVLFSSRTGDVTFPISPPSNNGATPGALDNTTIGATTPRPGNFTTLTSTSAPSGAGVTALFASPPPIGGTAAAAGKFTTLNASGQITSTAGAPTIASGACGATTNGTVTGTNQSGKVTIGAATTTTCTVSFSATLAAAPNSCVLFPASAGAAATGTTVAYVSSISTANFVITGSALASTVYYFLCL